jgi:AraC-like DNA-binding protein/ligand-binding sensor protein
MLLYTDHEKLEQLAKNFFNISQTLLSIYDDKQKLLCAYPHSLCDFCKEIRKDPILFDRCMGNDTEAFQKCKETRKLYMYRCHMGLIEVAAPIICNNIIIGYLLFGQITDQKDKTELVKTAKQVAIKYRLDISTINNGLNKIKYRSKEYIESILQLLEMCASYIWLNNIISVKTNSFAYSLEIYIHEHLRDDLSLNHLCREFNISRSSLYQISKDQFGCGISEYVQHCRINKAMELLQKRTSTVSEVAEMVGIADTNYFIRMFKKHIGITPKKYKCDE